MPSSHLLPRLAALAFSVAALAAPARGPAAAAGPAYLVKDVDTTGEPFVIPGGCPPGVTGFCPSDLLLYGGLPSQVTQDRLDVYFVADDRVHGSELWKSDGSAAGTRLVADLCPGPCGSSPRLIAEEGGLLFWADDGVHGFELWKTDGSAAGTNLVLDVCPGPCSGYAPVDCPGPCTGFLLDDATWLGLEGLPWTGRFGAGILFEARPDPQESSAPGSELWITDGTPAGTRKLFDFCPGGPCGGPIPELVFSRRPAPLLVGRVGDGAGRSGLWRITDPTAAPELLSDSAAPRPPMVDLGGRVFFVGNLLDSSTGKAVGGAVVSTDGTAEGTRVIWDQKAFAAFPVRIGQTGFFAVIDHGRVSIWETDGTAAGTRKAFDAPEELADVVEIVPFQGELYLEGLDRSTFKTSLWRTEGGVSSARRLGAGIATRAHFRIAADRLYFLGTDEAHGAELWVTGGTLEGTHRVQDVNPGPADAVVSLGPAEAGLGPVVGDRLYFSADDGVHGRELWALPLPTAGGPPRPDSPPLVSPEFPDFRFWVEIASPGGPPRIGGQAAHCLPETVCVTGAVPGRIEVFLRIVGPKGNGRLWPTLVRFSTSEIEVWIEQVSTGVVRYYDLPGASPGSDELPGRFDRRGFVPQPP